MKAKEKEVQQRVDSALKNVDTTKSVIIGSGALDSVTQCLTQHFDGKPALVIADTNTFKAAGRQVMQHMVSLGYPVLEPFIFDSNGLYAEITYVEQLQSYLAGKELVPIAVGSGTINDITKLASGRCSLAYMSVATAGSMDGYTAFGASISYKGAKQTFECKAPLAVVADIGVIAAAPREMNASGYADLIAKIPSGADWIVADALGIEPIDKVAWELTQTHLRSMVSNPSGILSADHDAMPGLMEGLIMTGLGMQVSKTSRPASGAEHQFSHLWDNQHHTYQGAAPSHGFKVGIGSLSSEALYEMILRKDAGDFDASPETIMKQWPSFSQIECQIREYFQDKELAEQTVAQSRAKYVTAQQLVERIQLLKAVWPQLKEKLRTQLLGAGQMQQMLALAGAPTHPEQIGISSERLKLSYRQAQLIRQRYTILDLVLETNGWADCVDPLFADNGFWTKTISY